MSADAFDRLEAELRGAVRAQAAAAPSTAGGRRRASTRWRRVPRRGGLLAAAAALLVAGGGAVAATQVWRVGAPDDSTRYLPAPSPDAGAGVASGAPRILPLHVADPRGGPPWALRTFASTRGGSCVQVGQVVDGRFGRMDGNTLRPVAAVPGQTSLCGFVARGGYPILRGLRRQDVAGGDGRGPITAVTTIRYGLLGPAARTATWRDGSGRRLMRMRTDPHGGAYLFIRVEDPAPYEAVDARRQAVEQRMKALIAKGVSPRAAMRRAAASVPARKLMPVRWATDGVDATFAGGTTLRVAGHGRTKAALPGVTRPKATNNRPDVRAPIHVTRSGPITSARFTVSFRAPVAITRADHHYTLTVTGRASPRCDRPAPAGGQASTHDIARGDVVTFAVRNGLGRRDGVSFCPGRHTLRVGYSAGSGPFAGRLVGAWSFTVPR
jgi:hypothetical protein